MSLLPKWLEGRAALVIGSGPAVEQVASALRGAGASVGRREAAAMELQDVVALFDAAGEVDLLVHAGTKLPSADPEVVGLETWRASFSSDLDGRFLFAAEFSRRRMQAGAPGNVLFLMPPLRAEEGSGLAATAHGALENLVKSLSVEWARDGVRINAIASRTVADFAACNPEQQASLGNLAAYLLSDYAAYITGTVSGINEG